MGDKSQIEWTDATWNPTYGCTKVSPECAHCYIERQTPYRVAGLKFDRKGHIPIQLHEDRLETPFRWAKPRRIFVNSLSDLFHEGVPDEFIDRVFAVMASSSRHTFQVLTKRAARMRAYMQRVADGAPAAGQRYESEMRAHFARYKREFKEGYSLPDPPTPELRFIYDSAVRQENRPTSPDGTTLDYGFSGGEYHWRPWPLSNVWLGVTAGNQRMADLRIPQLLQTPAAVRFISAEPLLGPVNLTRYVGNLTTHHLSVDVEGALANRSFDGLTENGRPLSRAEAEAGLRALVAQGVKRIKATDECVGFSDQTGCPGHQHPRLDWVIAGGESGPRLRPPNPDHVRSLRDQCVQAGVPFLFKQWGGKTAKSGGRLLDGRTWDEYPS